LLTAGRDFEVGSFTATRMRRTVRMVESPAFDAPAPEP
jgi:hypothetical protein